MERLNQEHNKEFDTIPDVDRIEDIPIGVWDSYGNNIGSLNMGFDLPDALSPDGVISNVTTATMESFGGDSVIVAPELVAEINEIGRRALASYVNYEADEQVPAEGLMYAEPIADEQVPAEELVYAETVAEPESADSSPPSATQLLNRFVELDFLAMPDIPAETPESEVFSEFDFYTETDLPLYLGSAGMAETIELELVDEQPARSVYARSL